MYLSEAWDKAGIGDKVKIETRESICYCNGLIIIKGSKSLIEHIVMLYNRADIGGADTRSLDRLVRSNHWEIVKIPIEVVAEGSYILPVVDMPEDHRYQVSFPRIIPINARIFAKWEK